MKFDTVRNRNRRRKRLCEERGRDRRRERGRERVMWSQAKKKKKKNKECDSYQELKEGRKHATLKPSEGGQCCMMSLISDFWFHKMMGEYISFI